MRFIIFLSCFLSIASELNSQNNTYKIPVSIDWANSFEFINNEAGIGCLLLTQVDDYCIVLVDSNYHELAVFKDKYYTSISPDYVGSIARHEGFEFYFRRAEENNLLILKIDIQSRSLKRVKDFNITETSDEKILYTGSTITGNNLMTLSYNRTDFIYKLHDFGQQIEDFSIPIKEEDRKWLKDGEFIQIQTDSLKGNLTMMFKIHKVTDKNPVFYILHIDPNKKEYHSTVVGCDQKKKYTTKAVFFEDIVLLMGCNGILMFDNNTGQFIKELEINFDSVRKNENFPVFAYSYHNPFSEFTDPRRYTYLTQEERSEYSLGELIDFDRDSSSVNLIVYGYKERYNNYPIVCRTEMTFDWNRKEALYQPTGNQNIFDNSMMRELEVKAKYKTKVSGYFLGFNKVCLGYLPKNSNEFIIEEVNF
jgi:hypothetical protein